jgi:uncharacterized OB-fold protein
MTDDPAPPEPSQPPDRPEPPDRVVLPEDEPFWAAIDEGRLDLVRCDACGAYSGFARSCVACGARAYSWVPAAAEGEVVSFVTFRRPYHRYFGDMLPYDVAVVRLEEGPDLLTNVCDVDVEEIVVGMRVRIVVRDRGKSRIPVAVPITSG